MKDSRIEIVYLPIEEIHDYENNPRNNDSAVDAVAKSIQRYGVRSPAIIDKDNIIIAGHTRIKAAKRLGMTEFPCVRADDLTKNQAKAFRLADNRIQEDSGWNIEDLQEEFESLSKNGFDLSETGFSNFEIDGINMNPDFFSADESEDEYDTPEMESGEYSYEGDETDDDSEVIENDYFISIICCRGEDELRLAAELLGEKGELKRRYTVTQIRKMLSDESDR